MANARPPQLHLGDQEMGTGISCTKCSMHAIGSEQMCGSSLVMVPLGVTHGHTVACVGTSLMLMEHLKRGDSLRAERELLRENVAQLARSAH